MKILILSNKDIASNFALNLLIPKIKGNHKLHLWLSAKVGKNSNQPEQLSRLKFFEQDLLNKRLNPLLIKSNTTKFTGFEGFKHYLDSEMREENIINASESIDRIQTLSPDLIISIRYGGILKDACIKIPKHGVINLHSGILPKYRGVMATFWAMLNDDKTIGTTLHTIDDGTIDTGKIIKISTMTVDKEKSYLQHVLELYRQGTLDIIDTIISLSKNEKVLTHSQHKSDCYFTFPKMDDLVKFENKGLKLIDEQAYLGFLCENYCIDSEDFTMSSDLSKFKFNEG
jgi:methionyl-tRNA formyltransferase